MTRPPHFLVSLFAALGLAAAVATLAPASPASAGAPSGTPTAFTSQGYRGTGPLFPHGTSSRHSCTASVVMSASHDLIMTAAHCLSGSVNGWKFVPKYMAGAAPYGVWTVTESYLPGPWLSNRDSHYDYAVLRVARQTVNGRSVGIQDVVGGYTVAAPRAGEAMRVPGYNGGLNDRPISCAVTGNSSGGYPYFNCHGYLGGTSGSPWLVEVGAPQREIHGLIGGFHQGGCYEYTSYSSPFNAQTQALVARAAAHQHPDIAPGPGGDGC
ncbi:hypothetical protein FHX74_003466 [Friedmanniella endophytica]|uniref:V8-like Glu-specific endopeptidase n=1 Tax=Microlunatus kandeliicorticis TaxID=1759536 RepID=A0A7W3P7C2_9ACTN|nr:trypsin-like peptidase domain-containing protein [Microlunatus kandeliicorticis]MBA8795825.1 hypothetical protein [Microlunatus kandeliicorticis]